MAKRRKLWIARAIHRPGRLHRDLGIPLDRPIPLGKLKRAAKGAWGADVARRARLALRLRRFRFRKRS